MLFFGPQTFRHFPLSASVFLAPTGHFSLVPSSVVMPTDVINTCDVILPADATRGLSAPNCMDLEWTKRPLRPVDAETWRKMIIGITETSIAWPIGTLAIPLAHYPPSTFAFCMVVSAGLETKREHQTVSSIHTLLTQYIQSKSFYVL